MRRFVAGLVLAGTLAACVVIPLPDSGPSLHDLTLPEPGDDEAAVRARFGTPQLFDGGRFLLYDWFGDRRFFVVAAIPAGVPVGGVTSKVHARLLIALDAERRVARMQCTVTGLDAQEAAALGCDGPEAFVQRSPDAEFLDLADLPRADISLQASWSADGRLLALTNDTYETWVVDLERRMVADRYAGVRSGFWTLKTAGPPRVALDTAGRRLALAQKNLPTVAFELDGSASGVTRPLGGYAFTAIATPCCAPGLVGLERDSAVWLGDDDEMLGRSGAEGRLLFDVHGVEIRRTSGSGPLRLAVLDDSWLETSPRALFGPAGYPRAILDARLYSASGGTASYAFAPGGALLARSTCSHLELWPSDELWAGLGAEGAAPPAVEPAQLMLRPLLNAPTASMPTPYDCPGGPVSFSRDGSAIAVADQDRIDVWRVADGSSLARYSVGAGSHVITVGFDARGALTAVTADASARLGIMRWVL